VLRKRHLGSGLAFAGLAILGSASPAAAHYRLEPTNTAFTATGTIQLWSLNGPRVTCTLSIGGAVDAKGVASIASASVMGAGDGCSGVAPLGLPWTMRVGGERSFQISGMSFDVPYFQYNPVCGPASVKAFDETTWWPFKRTDMGPCILTTGGLSPTPTIAIVAVP